ncbi:hypothetical protein FUAX_44390 (plasmid) [Fulvitalea axinellae]|uniref:Histidine phosphatase family protein n=1 Tax=Fulvitalea axinellae TaxID=1182444 RepID=A0AAU9D338_9BACT|nr:hypothetical protein FUAX_44390 [Fulvitalea axinellae]
MKKLWLTQLLLFFITTSFALSPAEDPESFYANQDEDKPLKIFDTEGSGYMQIVLVRHGEPDLKKNGWRSRKELDAFYQAYDSAHIVPFTTSPIDTASFRLHKVYHSNLSRASHTAQLIFGDTYTLVSDSRFREFERKAAAIPLLKLPTFLSKGISRGLWMAGLNDGGIENFKKARQRVRSNASFLEEEARQNGTALLVAHGMHNHYLAKYLEEEDWEIVAEPGDGDYLSVIVLVKRTTTNNIP